MIAAIAPLGFSAIVGYFLLHKHVIAPFHDVSYRQIYQLEPTQKLRLLLWDTLVPIDEFVDEGGAQRPKTYRSFREDIDVSFAKIQSRLPLDHQAKAVLENARADWIAADKLATELISVTRQPGDPEAAKLMERIHGKITSASDKLGAAYTLLESAIAKDHDIAVKSYERSVWLSSMAAFLSFLSAAFGVFLIGRVMSQSVDRLVEGAALFASGDRQHRIHIHIPPELRKVADEFNRMIERIHDYESKLSELARRDGLTGLMNRRAFDEALFRMYERMKRLGEQGALLILDIDHFKQVNDTHGHAAGDEVLRTVAETMVSELRPYDGVYRTGGEEFAVLLPGVGLGEAQDAAERVRKAVAAKVIKTSEAEISVTISIGAAKASEAVNPNELVQAADAALYRAKAGGRNRVIVIDEAGMHDSAKTIGASISKAG